MVSFISRITFTTHAPKIYANIFALFTSLDVRKAGAKELVRFILCTMIPFLRTLPTEEFAHHIVEDLLNSFVSCLLCELNFRLY